jgi:predicted MFS family arabinose efflux permease
VAAWVGGLLVAAWAACSDLVLFYLVWIGIGITHAGALSDPAYAVIVASAKEPRRVVTFMTFFTGFSTAFFVPFASTLVDALGWREALLVLAAVQVIPGAATWWALKGTRGGMREEARGGGAPLRQALKRRAFWALALCFCAQSFMSTGLAFHLIPMLQERGLPQQFVLLAIALHGPFQVGARAVLYLFGRGADLRKVGRIATLTLPLALLTLALAGANPWLVLCYTLLWGLANGLITIVRAAGVAEILGPRGFGQISGALTTAAMLPRTAAPLALALLWQAAGGYGPVAWVLAGTGLLAAAGFFIASAEPSTRVGVITTEAATDAGADAAIGRRDSWRRFGGVAGGKQQHQE